MKEVLQFLAKHQSAEIAKGHGCHHVAQQDEAARIVVRGIRACRSPVPSHAPSASFERIDGLIESAKDLPRWMAHEVLAHQAAGVASHQDKHC